MVLPTLDIIIPGNLDDGALGEAGRRQDLEHH
jgi:hypothetical protein